VGSYNFIVDLFNLLQVCKVFLCANIVAASIKQNDTNMPLQRKNMVYLFQRLDPSVPLVWFGCSKEQTFIANKTQAEGKKVLLKTCRRNQHNRKDKLTLHHHGSS